jgi:hypothetical protein
MLALASVGAVAIAAARATPDRAESIFIFQILRNFTQDDLRSCENATKAIQALEIEVRGCKVELGGDNYNHRKIPRWYMLRIDMI